MKKPNQPQAPRKDGPRVNDEISAHRIRLIDHEGNNHDQIDIAQALQMAADAGLDLVEISPNVVPPVCKILDYGKYKYELQKRKNEAKKKQKTIETKEVKFRPNIEQHDYDVKMRQVVKFLGEGDKVKITLRFRGREMAHQKLGMEVLNRIKTQLQDEIRVDQEPSLEGRQMMMVLSPAK
ncbi:MAG: translation initiation factor IF-3 [Alphaproteobacteria bacterium]